MVNYAGCSKFARTLLQGQGFLQMRGEHFEVPQRHSKMLFFAVRKPTPAGHETGHPPAVCIILEHDAVISDT